MNPFIDRARALARVRSNYAANDPASAYDANINRVMVARREAIVQTWAEVTDQHWSDAAQEVSQ